MSILSYFIWNADPAIFELFGREIRWYGLLFAIGFLISQQIMYYFHKTEGKPVEDVDTLTVYMVLATIIGARLGHVFFYEPARFLQDPISIIKFWQGGLASHGAVLAILVALYIYSKNDIQITWLKYKRKKINRENQSYLQVLDRIVIVIAMTACLIRFGNFMNSEIYGVPTKSGSGVVYAHNVTQTILSLGHHFIEDVSYKTREGGPSTENNYQPITIKLEFSRSDYEEEEFILFIENSLNNVLGTRSYVAEHIYEPVGHKMDYKIYQHDNHYMAEIYTYGIPRYPTQLYESITYLFIFVVLFMVWRKNKLDTKPGFIFGLFLVFLWSARFFFEFLKENQVAFEDTLPLNMGQWLSIPLILAGFYFLFRKTK